ncbi:MAG: hypothetical protein KBA90_09990 [Chitinophagaceae bacterium]|jgi:hypothetical protein|nr:hypothetical protein [Bacteroidota bacterium]MBP7108876.1 hypothetical protein [Chitinophagaceae bacterium]MBP7152143.1 hypothetical protein [Paludibacteraceae bacterium]
MKTAQQNWNDWANKNLSEFDYGSHEGIHGFHTQKFHAIYKGVRREGVIESTSVGGSISVTLFLPKEYEEFIFQDDTIESELTVMHEKIDIILNILQNKI